MAKQNPIKTILIIIITAILVGGTTYFLLNSSITEKSKEIVPEQEHQDWTTYTSDKGFSFQYPQGHKVTEQEDPENPEITIIFITEIDENGEFITGPPSLQINISENSVSFSLWEGIYWEGYPDIIGTYKSS